jgi:hypothetical protein
VLLNHGGKWMLAPWVYDLGLFAGWHRAERSTMWPQAAVELEHPAGVRLRVENGELHWIDFLGRTDIRGWVVRHDPGDYANWGTAVPAHGGRWGRAAVIHDHMYRTGLRSRAEADAVFLEGMRVLGVPWARRMLLCLAVRVEGGSSWRGRARGRGGQARP